MQLQETIFCSTAPSTSATGPGTISIHDIQTGSQYASFKPTNSSIHCTSFVESRNGEGGFVLAAQSDKSMLNVYTFQKDQVSLKMVLPEKLTCLTTDRHGKYCAGGTSQGRIYLWEVASGILYQSWDAHYRQVTVLRFTPDGAAILSGSEDSSVNVWSVSRLVDDDSQNELPTPFCTFSDHTLPITDIACGMGPFPKCRILTSSVDHSVKLWDLSSRSLLTTVIFPRPISCVTWDSTERLFFAASADGHVHQMNLFRQRETKEGGQFAEALGGAGVSDIVRVGEEGGGVTSKRLITVGQGITAISMSLTASLLLVGTDTGLIHVYDAPSRQLLRTISTHKGLLITHLATILRPPDLVGHINLSLAAGSGADIKDVIPVKPVSAFQRIKDPKLRETHELPILLPPQSSVLDIPYMNYTQEEFLRDHAFFAQPMSSASSRTQPDSTSLKATITNLEAEVAQLREQLGKAKSVNDVMWDTVVQRVVAQSRNKDTGTADGSEHRQKRSRA